MTDGRTIPARSEIPAIVPRDLPPFVAGSMAALAVSLLLVAWPGDGHTSAGTSDRAP